MNKKIFLAAGIIVLVFLLTGCQKQSKEQQNKNIDSANKPSKELSLAEKKATAVAEASRRALEKAGIDPDNPPPPPPQPDFYLHWYNPQEDTNKTCDGRFYVRSSPRFVEDKDNLINQAFHQLFSGELSEEEKSAGFVGSPFSDFDFTIKSINLDEQGVLRIDFEDNSVLDKIRGLCGGETFVFAVHDTAQQFTQINRVLFDRAYDIPIR